MGDGWMVALPEAPRTLLIDWITGRRDPFSVYSELRERGPVSRIPGGLVAVDYATCRRVLTDPAWHTATRRGAGRHYSLDRTAQTMLWKNPPDHAPARKEHSREFTPKALAALHPTVRRHVTVAVDRLEAALARGPADFVEHVAAPLPVAVVGEVLALPEKERHEIPRRTQQALAIQELAPSHAQLATADEAARWLGNWSHRYLAADLDADSTWNLVLMLSAGTTTSSALIGSVGLLVAQSPPERLRELTKQASAERAVEELLRFDPPIHIATRVSAKETALPSGHVIAAGTTVHAVLASAGRDPLHIDGDPDQLDLARTPTTHLAFGAGPHYCLGAQLARMEAAETLMQLATRLPDLTTAGPARRPARARVLRHFASLPMARG